MIPILLIHGGAGSKSARGSRQELFRQSLEKILNEGYAKLAKGSALDAVVCAVQALENDPLYNAGFGSRIQRDGVIRMSASLMDGARGKFSGCINVRRIKNPILLAKALLREKDRVLAETGAEDYARKKRHRFASPYTVERRAEFKAHYRGKSGTVGAIALDRHGRLAAATSTGGRGYEFPHRVSDSATVAGNYANLFGAVSATGTGEHIVDLAAAASLCTLLENGVSLKAAASKLLRKARGAKASFGWIALDRRGNFSTSTTTSHLIWGMARGNKRVLNP